MRYVLLLLFLFSCGFVWSEISPSPSIPLDEVKELKSVTNQFSDSETNTSIVNKPLSAAETFQPSVMPGVDEMVFDYFSSQWWLVYITAGLAIFTAGLFYATVSLSSEAKANSERQAGEMEKSLAIAKESLDMARRTVESMENTAERQLRAYIFANSGEPMSSDSSGALKATIMVKNYGQTPAYDVRCCAYIALLKHSHEEIFDSPNYISGSMAALAPSGNPIIQFPKLPRPLTNAEIDSIRTEESAIFVWGEIAYIDIFKKNRITKFRFYSSGDGFERMSLAHYHEGNDVD